MTNNLIFEAEHFDFLSILAVKNCRNPQNPKNQRYYDICFQYLALQLGDKMNIILQSKEYLELFEVNEVIWDLIDLYRQKKESVGDKIDFFNLQRYEYKQKLQKVHFGNEIFETKLTYESNLACGNVAG